MNEVNGTPYWDGDPDAGAYAKILKPASRKIRKKDPRAKIMLAGMFFAPRAPEAIDSWDYLRQLYNEGTKGILRHRRDPSLLDDPGGGRERHPEDEGRDPASAQATAT